MKPDKVYLRVLEFCIGKGVDATDERIMITVNYVRSQGFRDDQIVAALNRLFGSTPFFPDASAILKELRPSNEDIQTEANLIAGEIIESLSTYGGVDNLMAARKHLGEKAWLVVIRFGGWHLLSSISNRDLTSTRAQLRDIAAGITRIDQGVVKNRLEYSERAAKQIEGLKRPDFKLVLSDQEGA